MQYYIVFRDTPHKLLKHIFKKGFQHCYVICKDEFNYFRLDPRNNYLKVDILPWSVDEFNTIIIPRHINIISYSVDHKDSQHPNFALSLINCVTITKYILGLTGFKSFFIQTPWQLYKYLKKRN